MLTVLNVNDSGGPLMSRTRLFTESNLGPGAEITLSGDAARYLGRVLRLRQDDEVTVFNGEGGEYEATVVSLAKSSVTLRTGNFVDREAESPLSIHLLQGLARGERMDLVVQKATELGVGRITPLVTEYGVVRLDGQRARKRTAHWRGVATSACEQCGRNRLPVIDEPIGFREWLGANPAQDSTRLILRPGTGRLLASELIESTSLVLLIGPEGGFSDAEYELAELTGFEPIGLGPRILRTETAALAALAALQALRGDMG
jgi:16S rRNA (uracil1498-N3)-methyltransferase